MLPGCEMRLANIPGRAVRRLQRSVNQLRDRASVRGLILAYHRIADLDFDPQLLAVSPDNFREHLDVLKRNYQSDSLRTCSSGLRARLPMVALTFDDGYVDNFQVARPILEQADVPATFFVTSGFIDTAREFYWDELAAMLLGPDLPAGQLTVTIGMDQHVWEFTDTDLSGCLADWNVTQDTSISTRQNAYACLCAKLKWLPDSERQRILDRVAGFCKMLRPRRDAYRVMQSHEIAELSNSNLIEIGAHTVSHPSLPALAPEVAANEVTQSKKELEAVIGKAVTSFAFPYGEVTDFNNTTLTALQNSGFEQACINCPGLLVSRTRPLLLPRFIVRNWNGEEFARHLRLWLTQPTAVYL